MKMKEIKLHLATILIIATYYLIFTLMAKLEFVDQLSDFGFYGLQMLVIVIEGMVASIVLVKSNYWKECGQLRFR